MSQHCAPEQQEGCVLLYFSRTGVCPNMIGYRPSRPSGRAEPVGPKQVQDNTEYGHKDDRGLPAGSTPTQTDAIITVSASPILLFIFARRRVYSCTTFGSQNRSRCRHLVGQTIGPAQNNAAVVGYGSTLLADSGPAVPEKIAPPQSEEPRPPFK